MKNKRLKTTSRTIAKLHRIALDLELLTGYKVRFEVTRDFDDPRRKLYSFCCVPKKDCPGTWGFVYAANTVRGALNNFFRDFAYFNDFELAHLAPSTNPLAINNINRL